jgi:hypothetical protein
MSSELLKAIAVTAELCGKEFSDAAARQFVRDLAPYPVAQVLKGLDRCRRELQRPLTLAAVLERIDDGRPGAEEAWAMLPQDEDSTVVWTTEMAEAWGISRELDDKIAARMAFKEAYSRIIGEARASQRPPVWQASLGHNPDEREHVLLQAVAKGRLTQQHFERLLPYHKTSENELLALAKGMQMLEDKRNAPLPESVRTFMENA